jgi:hypothetical protein
MERGLRVAAANNPSIQSLKEGRTMTALTVNKETRHDANVYKNFNSNACSAEGTKGAVARAAIDQPIKIVHFGQSSHVNRGPADDFSIVRSFVVTIRCYWASAEMKHGSPRHRSGGTT